jgi:hypothetical protein
MKQLRSAMMLILCIVVLTACATVPLTPEQQAQSALSKAQGQLNVYFDTANAYYKGKQDKVAEWKGTVVPVFDTANKSLKKITLMLQAGEINAASIDVYITPILNDVLMLLVKLEVLK